MTCPSTHGGAGWPHGSIQSHGHDRPIQITCGVCGVTFEWKKDSGGWYPVEVPKSEISPFGPSALQILRAVFRPEDTNDQVHGVYVDIHKVVEHNAAIRSLILAPPLSEKTKEELLDDYLNISSPADLAKIRETTFASISKISPSLTPVEEKKLRLFFEREVAAATAVVRKLVDEAVSAEELAWLISVHANPISKKMATIAPELMVHITGRMQSAIMEMMNFLEDPKKIESLPS